MKSFFSHHIKQIVFLGALLFGINALAQTYTPPTAPAPGNNTPVPIYTNAINQSKAGGLSVGTFVAEQAAQFNGMTTVATTILGEPTSPGSSNSVLKIGGITAGGNNHTVTLEANGTIATWPKSTVTPSLYALNTTNTSGLTRPLCAENDGTIIVCPVPPPTPELTVTDWVRFYGRWNYEAQILYTPVPNTNYLKVLFGPVSRYSAYSGYCVPEPVATPYEMGEVINVAPGDVYAGIGAGAYGGNAVGCGDLYMKVQAYNSSNQLLAESDIFTIKFSTSATSWAALYSESIPPDEYGYGAGTRFVLQGDRIPVGYWYGSNECNPLEGYKATSSDSQQTIAQQLAAKHGTAANYYSSGLSGWGFEVYNNQEPDSGIFQCP